MKLVVNAMYLLNFVQNIEVMLITKKVQWLIKSIYHKITVYMFHLHRPATYISSTIAVA